MALIEGKRDTVPRGSTQVAGLPGFSAARAPAMWPGSVNFCAGKTTPRGVFPGPWGGAARPGVVHRRAEGQRGGAAEARQSYRVYMWVAAE
jgi:hypothetical protein